MRKVFQFDADMGSYGLIDKYLRNRLNEEQREAVELRLLDDDDFFEKATLADSLHEALNAEEQRLRNPAPSLAPAGPGLGAWLRQPLSMAASLGLAVMLVLQFQTWMDSGNAPLAFSVPSHTIVETFRGAQQISVSGPAPHLLQIDAGLDADPSYTVLLRGRDSGELAFEEAGVAADDSGWVRVLLVEPLAGEYTLELRGEDSQLHYNLLFQRFP